MQKGKKVKREEGSLKKDQGKGDDENDITENDTVNVRGVYSEYPDAAADSDERQSMTNLF
jgi:hypothetical protein